MNKQIMLMLGAVILVLGAVNLAEAVPVHWSTSSGGNDHWYDVITTPSTLSWEQARDDAQSSGWHLVTITSAEEDSFVFNVLNNQRTANASKYWLGGYQPAGSSEPDGGWSWVTGESWSYENWSVGEPNNVGNQNYLHYWPDLSSGWDDVNAGYGLVGYVVEAIPEPTSGALIGLFTGGIYFVRRFFLIV